ncbi:hypothetical protein BLNAU_5982 [Blattamonas nauphoetae]|uniref:Uncharacterized protein n=1 Tax=Blattamonas nauphoetae TaxID=2049346 RepID=A0ABQ9Y5F2_9EUKA|nr:hypothetical protein BLNAU_5982 [Blattamonas nauphoetae]
MLPTQTQSTLINSSGTDHTSDGLAEEFRRCESEFKSGDETVHFKIAQSILNILSSESSKMKERSEIGIRSGLLERFSERLSSTCPSPLSAILSSVIGVMVTSKVLGRMSSSLIGCSFVNMSSIGSSRQPCRPHLNQKMLGCALSLTSSHLSGSTIRDMNNGGSVLGSNSSFSSLLSSPNTNPEPTITYPNGTSTSCVDDGSVFEFDGRDTIFDEDKHLSSHSQEEEEGRLNTFRIVQSERPL